MIHVTMDKKLRRRMEMDLKVCMESKDCPHTITFYGALFGEVCIHVIYSCAIFSCNQNVGTVVLPNRGTLPLLVALVVENVGTGTVVLPNRGTTV